MEQLSLFEDKYILLNRGCAELAKLNLKEARLLLQRYGDIYRDHEAVESKLKITDFLIRGFESITDSGPDKPAYLYDLMNEAEATAWLACHAFLRGLFKPKQIRLKDELKRFVNDYLTLRKAYLKHPTPLVKPKLFLRAIVLCDNEAALQSIKGIDFIEIRRHMKEINPALFAQYMKQLSKRR